MNIAARNCKPRIEGWVESGAPSFYNNIWQFNVISALKHALNTATNVKLDDTSDVWWIGAVCTVNSYILHFTFICIFFTSHSRMFSLFRYSTFRIHIPFQRSFFFTTIFAAVSLFHSHLIFTSLVFSLLHIIILYSALDAKCPHKKAHSHSNARTHTHIHNLWHALHLQPTTSTFDVSSNRCSSYVSLR